MKSISKIIIKHKNKYLFYLRDNNPRVSFANHRDLFGGVIEEGESPLQGAIRELQEELSIQVSGKDLNHIETVMRDIVECYMYGYEMSEHLLDNLILGEGQEMKRYTQSEIQSLELVHWYRKYFIKSGFSKEDFEQRGKHKRLLQQRTKSKKVLQGEIWIAKIGINIGSEIGKEAPFVRPVLVIQTNCGGDLVYVIPMSTQYTDSKSSIYHYFEQRKMYGVNKPTYFVLNQARYMSKKRLVRKINNIEINGKKINIVDKDFCLFLLDMVFCHLKNLSS